MRFTDKEMLDWLDKQNAKSKYTGVCQFRWSSTGRGWRLHETSDMKNSFLFVRNAIEDAMVEEMMNEVESGESS